jgi:hypothetical protein
MATLGAKVQGDLTSWQGGWILPPAMASWTHEAVLLEAEKRTGDALARFVLTPTAESRAELSRQLANLRTASLVIAQGAERESPRGDPESVTEFPGIATGPTLSLPPVLERQPHPLWTIVHLATFLLLAALPWGLIAAVVYLAMRF